MLWFDVVGLVGLFLALVGFACVQWQRDFSRRTAYAAMNLMASLMVICQLYHRFHTGMFAIATVWGLISLYGLHRCSKYKWRVERVDMFE